MFLIKNFFKLSCKQSYSLVQLGLYIIATGFLSVVLLNGKNVLENTKITRLIDEISFYNGVNKQFVLQYSSFPGLMTYEKCITYFNDDKICRNQDDINLTTNEYVYNRYKDGCNHAIGCFINANGTTGDGGEDILRMFLLPMRYLKTAKLIDTVDIGLDKQLSENENYSHKVWAKSKVDNSVYINIYNYSNQDKDLTRAFLFSGQKIFGHTINSGLSYDHRRKLESKSNQYLLYVRKSEGATGAIPASIAYKADIKFDDGKPMTGIFTTFSTSTFTDDFKNSEYAKCVTEQPIDENSLINAEYNIKANGNCNISYQLDNLIEYIDYGGSLNYGKPLNSSFSGIKKCTTYQNVSMCESAKSKSDITNKNVAGGKDATNFAYYTLTYPDGSTRVIDISRRFVRNGGMYDIYVKNNVTGEEIKGTGGCWYNYEGHRRTACFGPTTINGRGNGYYCCHANNINELLQM